MRRVTGSLLLVLSTGCAELGLDVDVSGEVVVAGTAPAAYDLALYAWSDNRDAFDAGWCPAGDDDCLGRVDVGRLDTPVRGASIDWDGSAFTMRGVPADLLYVLRATGDDPAVDCSEDVVGFDEERKVVTRDSAIAIDPAAGGTFTVPRPVRLSCAVPLAEPTLPDPADTEPPEVPEAPDTTTPEGDITVPDTSDPTATWTTFVVTEDGGGEIGGDASAGSVVTLVGCGGAFPPVLRVRATTTDTAASRAWLRIQFGSGADAKFQTTEVPLKGGEVDQAFSLTGGYAVVQLDLDEALDGVGETHTVTFCEPTEPPGAELVALLTWDTDDTDVDLHIDSDHEEVAFYSLHQSWGDLDLDDIDGYGPETFSSAPDATGRDYTVWAHHYSDHGNGKTVATVRVVYTDPDSGETCDVTASKEIPEGNWFRIGKFGPGLACTP